MINLNFKDGGEGENWEYSAWVSFSNGILSKFYLKVCN